MSRDRERKCWSYPRGRKAKNLGKENSEKWKVRDRCYNEKWIQGWS
jgi:hypothetical protein